MDAVVLANNLPHSPYLHYINQCLKTVSIRYERNLQRRAGIDPSELSTLRGNILHSHHRLNISWINVLRAHLSLLNLACCQIYEINYRPRIWSHSQNAAFPTHFHTCRRVSKGSSGIFIVPSTQTLSFHD